jgi:hypothetical protein
MEVEALGEERLRDWRAVTASKLEDRSAARQAAAPLTNCPGADDRAAPGDEAIGERVVAVRAIIRIFGHRAARCLIP